MVQPQLFDPAFGLPRAGGGVEVGARIASSILTCERSRSFADEPSR